MCHLKKWKTQKKVLTMPSLPPPMVNSVRSVVKMSTTKATLKNTSREWRSTQPQQIGFNLSWELGIGNFGNLNFGNLVLVGFWTISYRRWPRWDWKRERSACRLFWSWGLFQPEIWDKLCQFLHFLGRLPVLAHSPWSCSSHHPHTHPHPRGKGSTIL